MPPQVATYSVYCNVVTIYDNGFLLVCIFLPLCGNAGLERVGGAMCSYNHYCYVWCLYSEGPPHETQSTASLTMVHILPSIAVRCTYNSLLASRC